MKARKLIIGIVVLLALAITSLGCYTIIKHPSTLSTSENVEGDSSAVDETTAYSHGEYDRDCMRCHSDYNQYPYGYYYNYYPDYYWSDPRWGSYYAYPWWWETYYEDNGGEIVADTVDQIAKPDRRRGIAPPYSRGVDPVLESLPFNSNPSTPGVGGTGGTSTGGTATTPTTNDGKDEKKEDQKPPRRRGK